MIALQNHLVCLSVHWTILGSSLHSYCSTRYHDLDKQPDSLGRCVLTSRAICSTEYWSDLEWKKRPWDLSFIHPLYQFGQSPCGHCLGISYQCWQRESYNQASRKDYKFWKWRWQSLVICHCISDHVTASIHRWYQDQNISWNVYSLLEHRRRTLGLDPRQKPGSSMRNSFRGIRQPHWSLPSKYTKVYKNP